MAEAGIKPTSPRACSTPPLPPNLAPTAAAAPSMSRQRKWFPWQQGPHGCSGTPPTLTGAWPRRGAMGWQPRPSLLLAWQRVGQRLAAAQVQIRPSSGTGSWGGGADAQTAVEVTGHSPSVRLLDKAPRVPCWVWGRRDHLAPLHTALPGAGGTQPPTSTQQWRPSTTCPGPAQQEAPSAARLRVDHGSPLPWVLHRMPMP